MTKWMRHLYQPGLPLGDDGRRVTGCDAHIQLARDAARECMVLLKNDGQILPIKAGAKVALFGKATIDYVKGGGGSGDVTVAYTKSLYDGMKEKEDEGKIAIFPDLIDFYKADVAAQYHAGYEPGMTKEPAIPTKMLADAADFADVAIISICRFSGEGWDRNAEVITDDIFSQHLKALTDRQQEVFPDGDFNLTAGEKKMIADVKANFDKVIVVLNIGGMMETAWIAEDEAIDAALLAWQGGMEGGRAAADILVGDGYPSGKLTDTFARTLEDYPSTANFHESGAYAPYTEDIYVGYRYFETIPQANEKVIYPFGYGLTYTDFELIPEVPVIDENAGTITVSVEVKNVGGVAGKEVVQLYYSAPDGLLGKPAKELGAFAKTGELAPGEAGTAELVLPIGAMGSYDDMGRIAKSAYVLEAGSYKLTVSNGNGKVVDCGSYEVESNRVIEQLNPQIVPAKLPKRMLSDGSYEELPVGEYPADPSIFPRMTALQTEGVFPEERARARYYGYAQAQMHKQFIAVAEGEMTLDEFLDEMTVEDHIWLLGGQKNHGVSNTFGVGNMPEYGIPEVTTADGPAGLRIRPEVGVATTAWPCATMLACSFNPELAEAIGQAVAKEVKENNIGIWLAPAVNIHRSPLCGRNFEYYSEDPLLAGKIGAAVVRGVQSQRIAATVKHFAFNNKETNRKYSDSRVSERAAREIYLKPFEIIVKEAGPWCIMTSYNEVNGTRCSENAELINGILRGEWGFDGVVMTDWWTSGEHYLEARAGNDLKMGNGYADLVAEAYAKGEISASQIRAAARNVLNLILRME